MFSSSHVINRCVPVISVIAPQSLHSSPWPLLGRESGSVLSGHVCSWQNSGAILPGKGSVPTCLGHRCNLNNKHLIPSSSYLAEVVLLNDALLRGHRKGQMFSKT